MANNQIDAPATATVDTRTCPHGCSGSDLCGNDWHRFEHWLGSHCNTCGGEGGRKNCNITLHNLHNALAKRAKPIKRTGGTRKAKAVGDARQNLQKWYTADGNTLGLTWLAAYRG
jgi:hypothetical protein